jgi:hypothetical protein
MLGLKMNLGGTGNLGNGMVDNGKTKIWLKNGRKHRLNGPAEIDIDGYEAWFFNGQRHRPGNKPAVTYPNGNKEYWENGELIKKENSSKNK